MNALPSKTPLAAVDATNARERSLIVSPFSSSICKVFFVSSLARYASRRSAANFALASFLNWLMNDSYLAFRSGSMLL